MTVICTFSKKKNESLAKSARYSDLSFAELMDDLDNFGKFVKNNSVTIEKFDTGVIAILTGGNQNYRQGVHWVIKDIAADANTFSNKTLKLEYSIANSRGTTSSIDLFCLNCDVPNLKIEYKSGPGSMSSTTIKEQFIERDLFNANSLNELQWRMTNTQITKEKLVNWLTEHKTSIESLGFEKINQLFGTAFNQFTSSTVLSDKVISQFSSATEYNKIFK